MGSFCSCGSKARLLWRRHGAERNLISLQKSGISLETLDLYRELLGLPGCCSRAVLLSGLKATNILGVLKNRVVELPMSKFWLLRSRHDQRPVKAKTAIVEHGLPSLGMHVTP